MPEENNSVSSFYLNDKLEEDHLEDWGEVIVALKLRLSITSADFSQVYWQYFETYYMNIKQQFS